VDVFFLSWLLFAYAIYIFIAERLSLFPPRKYNSDKHGIRAYKRVLGYWALGSLVIAGFTGNLLMPNESPIVKGIISIALSVVLCIPGAFRFYLKRHAS